MNKPWSDSENDAIVEDYFDMLRLELKNEKFNKAAHSRNLRERLNERTKGSVEMKHQNISHILIQMGIPYINGYKPYGHVQNVLSDAVKRYLENRPDLHNLISEINELVPPVPKVADILAIMGARPENTTNVSSSYSHHLYSPTGINYLEREAQNMQLGEAGEELVIEYERARLIQLGKDSLADRVEHKAVSVGPSAGYDILSFEENGAERFIEAKTTKYGIGTPFYLTSNELRFSQDHSSQYFLYRLYKFGEKPHMFSLDGDLNIKCELKPSVYVAKSV